MEQRTLYFQDTETNSDKVYTAVINGSVVTVLWGRRGGSMQKQEKTFDNHTQAYGFWYSKLAEKRAKGYRESLDAFQSPAPISTGELKASKWTASEPNTILNHLPATPQTSKRRPAFTEPKPQPDPFPVTARRKFRLED